MDDVDLALRCHRIHAVDILEAKVVSNEPIVSQRLHGTRSIFHLGDRLILPVKSGPGSSAADAWDLCRSDALRLSNEV